jgi:nitrate/TMAO reductase-like tetraheme cytochrome c subunit
MTIGCAVLLRRFRFACRQRESVRGRSLRRVAGPWAAALLLIPLCTGAPTPPPASALDAPPPAKYPEYQPSSSCRICHEKQYAQHQESLHARSFSDPVFQAQYVKELLPLTEGNPELAEEADRCSACHSPISFQKKKGRAGPERAVDESLSGVVCDFCHRVGAYKGARPGSGNFMSSPGDMKFGPFKVTKSDWHHIYHELQTKSEFCAICHNDVNRFGLEIKATYTEWQASPYAKRGIQCQDCHMNTQGFLTDGRPVFESGKATVMTVGSSVDRTQLYSHRFPGTRVRTQMEIALALDMKIDQATAAPGEEVTVRLEVANRNVGHSIPTGSTDLRLLWLELAVETPGGSVLVPAVSTATGAPYDVAGRVNADAELLGGDVPAGSRIYRSIFVDAAGVQTLASYNAARIAFDNRLKAEEVRTERYTFRVPGDAREPLAFTARVRYLPYPGSFARALAIAPSAPQLLAETGKFLVVGPRPE